jgi:uncharacterized coiled-coil protein SlyX
MNPESEIEKIAKASGHATFIALAEWLKANRESLKEDLDQRNAELDKRFDKQDRALDDLKRELSEVKLDGKETKTQAKLTNGRVNEFEVEKRITAALQKEHEVRATFWDSWGKVFAGAFVVGAISLILHLAGAA